MDDEQLDERLRNAARSYNQPPEAPRDAMWQAIQRARQPQREAVRRWRRQWVPLAAAAAAVLALGVGIGRVTSAPEAVTPAAPTVGVDAAAAAGAYRLATLEHLSQSEEFLTLFRVTVGQGSDHHLASATARRLLATNRLLLDSPASTDRQTRLLLEDLELVLAGIAQLSPQSPAQDLELIREGLKWGDVMPRLRTAVPAGVVSTQGVL